MSNSNYKKVFDFLENKQDSLHTIYAKVNFLTELDQVFKTFLDENQKKFSQVVNYMDGILTVIVTNAAFASVLKFDSFDLIQRLRQTIEFRNIEKIKCKIALPPPTEKKEKNQRVNVLSNKSAMIINQIADDLTDLKLKSALKRIASHTQIDHE